jgi:threonine dehydrogenase-like Zn-dependent dehydrogenase
MKALNYAGPFTVRVEDVEVPKLEHPDDVIVKVTTVGRSMRFPRAQFSADR